MSTSDGSDMRRVARCCEPVVNGSPDTPTLHGWITRAMMAGDKQQDPIAPHGRPFERPIDCCPGRIEVHAVKIEDCVRRDIACSQALVPASVESAAGNGIPPRWHCWRLFRRRDAPARLDEDFSWLLCDRQWCWLVAGQRANRRSDELPELLFFRAERAHGQPCPSAPGSALLR